MIVEKTVNILNKKSKITPQQVLKTQIGKLYFEENASQLPLFLKFANAKFSIDFEREILIYFLKQSYFHFESNTRIARIFWDVTRQYSSLQSYPNRINLYKDETIVELLGVDNELVIEVFKLPKLKYVDYYKYTFQLLNSNDLSPEFKPQFAYFLIQFLFDKPSRTLHFNKNSKVISKQRLIKCEELYQFIEEHSFFSAKYFLVLINTEVELSPVQIMELFINKYVSYCGISLGYRTFYWDIAWEYLSRNELLWNDVNEDEPGMIDYFQLHFPLLYEEYKSYDIGRLETYDYISMGIDEIRTGELPFDIQVVVARYLFLYLEDV